MPDIVGLLFTLLALAVLVWGGERLLALFPGNERIKQIIASSRSSRSRCGS